MNRKIILLPLSVAALLVLGACGKTTTSSAAPVSSAAATSSKKEVAPTAITAAELIEWNAAQDQTADTKDGDTLFTMSGILEGWAGATGTDDYGDCYLTDPTTLKSVLVYGSTTTKTCIAGDAGSYAFTNPKDAKTTLKDYKNGEKATMTFVRECYKGKLEITGYFTAHVADTTKYTATVATGITNGTVVLDKASDLAYGDTITATVTPATGYEVDSVLVTDTQGTDHAATVDAADATKYTFTARCVNTVKATFKVHEAVKSSYDIKGTDSALPTAYAPGKTDTTVPDAITIDTLPLVFFNVAVYNASGIMQFAGDATKYTAGLGRLYNTAATTRAIASIALTFPASKYANNAPSSFTIGSGTAAMATALTTADVTPVKNTDGSYTATYTPTATTDTFFSITKTATNTYSQYVSEIVVTMVAA